MSANAQTKATEKYQTTNRENESMYNLSEFVNDLINGQNAEIVNSGKEADYVLCLDKAQTEKEISLLDNNFFITSEPDKGMSGKNELEVIKNLCSPDEELEI